MSLKKHLQLYLSKYQAFVPGVPGGDAYDDDDDDVDEDCSSSSETICTLGELIDIPNPNVDPVCESKADQKLQQLAQQFLLAKSKASKCQGENVEVTKKLQPPEQPKEPTKKASTPNAALLPSFVSCLWKRQFICVFLLLCGCLWGLWDKF